MQQQPETDRPGDSELRTDQYGMLPIGTILRSQRARTTRPFLSCFPMSSRWELYEQYHFDLRIYDAPEQRGGERADSRSSSARATPPPDGNMAHFARSNYAVCFGSNTHGKSSSDYTTDGAFQRDVGKPLSDFTDGTSNTIVASEVIAGTWTTIHDDNRRRARAYGPRARHGGGHVHASEYAQFECGRQHYQHRQRS